MGAGVGREVKQITKRLADFDTEERRLRQALVRLRHARELLVSNDDMRDDHLTFTDRVTRRHGEIFAKVLLGESLKTEGPFEAFLLTDVIEWPGEEEEDDTPAKVRYSDLQSQILRRTFDAVERTISETFVKIATDVITRERARDRTS